MGNKENLDQLLKPEQVAKILQTSKGYPYLLAKRGLLPSIQIPSPSKDRKTKCLLRFKKSDVLNFIEKYYQQGGKS